MQTISILPDIFKQIVSATKNSVATDDTRPALRFIKLVVQPDKLIAYSCNGYAGARISVSCQTGTEEAFTCYFRPISFLKTSRCGYRNVLIEHDPDNYETHITVPADYGTICYNFKDVDYQLDLDKIIDNNVPYLDRQVSFQGTLMSAAAQTFASAQVNKGYFTLFTQENSNAPVVMHSETRLNFRDGDGAVKLDYLLLPVRMSEQKID